MVKMGFLRTFVPRHTSTGLNSNDGLGRSIIEIDTILWTAKFCRSLSVYKQIVSHKAGISSALVVAGVVIRSAMLSH